MNELFYTVLSLSVSGSLVALALFALRPLWRDRLRKSWQYYIWLLVLLRLALPLGPQNSLMNTLFADVPLSPAAESAGEAAASQAVRQEAGVVPALAGREETETGAPPAQLRAQMQVLAAMNRAPQPAGAASTGEGSLSPRLWVAWLAGAGLLLARKLGSYHLFLHRLKPGLEPVEDPALLAVYRAACREAGVRRPPVLLHSGAVGSPMLVGTLRPRVILPREGGGEDMRGVLLHELTHHRRRDLWYKWLAQLVLCVHWFNPVAHLTVREIGRACELSCDEAVLRTMDPKQQYSYGDTLLATVGRGKALPASAGSLSLGEDARLLKERLGSILKYKNKPRYTRYISIALTALLLTGALFAGVYAATGAAPVQQAASGISALKKTPAQLENIDPRLEEAAPLQTAATPGREKFQTVTLPPLSGLQDILVTVESAGIRVLPTENTVFSYEYRADLHEVSYTTAPEQISIAVDGSIGNNVRGNGWEDTSLYLYVPAGDWRKLRIEAESSAVSTEAIGAAFSLEADNSAVSVAVPEGFLDSLQMKCNNSAVSVILSQELTDAALTLRSSSSAVSLPKGFPAYLFQREYSYTLGNGTAKIDLEVTNCAFSMGLKKEAGSTGSYVGDVVSGSISDAISGALDRNSSRDNAWNGSWNSWNNAWAGAWSEGWKNAWEDSGAAAYYSDIFQEAWDEAWNEAWDAVDWEEIWNDAWEEAMAELRAEFSR